MTDIEQEARAAAGGARRALPYALNHFTAGYTAGASRPASPATRGAVTVDDLIETTAGLALANAAWQEGASAMLRSVNEHESGPWTKPVSPYSAPLLKRLADIRERSE